MSTSWGAVGSVAGVGTGLVVPVIVAAVLTVAALVVATRELRRSGSRDVVAASLLGAGAIVAQLWIGRQSPASQVGFVLGIFAGLCWYGATVWAGRTESLPEQTLAVGSLLWIAGTVTVAISLTAANWPIIASLLGSGGVMTVAGAVSWRTKPTEKRARQAVRLGMIPGSAVALPAVADILFGEEVLFVLYLIVFVVAVICWQFYRLSRTS